jgi:WD40 repeat protein
MGLIVLSTFSYRAQARKLRADNQFAGRPQLVVQLGHTAPVMATAFSRDGRFVATGSFHEAILWERNSGREVRRFPAKHGLSTVAFTPDSRSLLLGETGVSGDGLRLVEIATWREVWRKPAKVDAAFFSSDGKLILTSSDHQSLTRSADDSIIVWWRDAATGAEVRRVNLKWPSFSPGQDSFGWSKYAILSPDARWILTGILAPTFEQQPDAPALLWNAETGELAQKFERPGRLRAAAFSPNGQYVLIASDDRSARLWEVASGRQAQRFDHQFEISSVAFSIEGNRALTVAVTGRRETNTIRTAFLWDIARGNARQLFSWESHWTQGVSASFSPDGQAVMTANRGLGMLAEEDRGARLWDAETGEQIQEFDGRAGKLQSAVVSPDGRYIVTASADHNAYVWEVATGKVLHRLEGHKSAVNCAAFSKDSKWIATGSNDGTVWLWETSTGRRVQHFEWETKSNRNTPGSHAQAAVTAVALSSDGSQVLAASWYQGVRLWQASGQLLHRFPHSGSIFSVAFSPDDRYVMTAAGSDSMWQFSGDDKAGTSDNTLRRWDAATGQQARSFKFEKHPLSSTGCTAIVSSPDGRFVLARVTDYSLRDNRDYLWDLESTREEPLTVPSSGQLLAFSSDGGHLAFLDGQGHASVGAFDAGLPQRIKLQPYAEPHDGPYALAFSPDRRFAVAESAGEITRLRDPFTGQELCRLVTFRDGGWVVVDAAGRFDASSLEEIRGLHWIMPDDPLRPLPLEIYMRDYYYPRLLQRILAGEELKPVRDISRLNRAQPSVKIISVEQQKDQPELAKVTVEITQAPSPSSSGAASEARDAYDLRLFRDGQLVGQYPPPEGGEKARAGFRRFNDEEKLKAWRDKSQVELDGVGKRLVTFPVRLPRREQVSEVQFSAYAFNNDRIKSATYRRALKLKQAIAPVKGRAFIVSVGVNRTESPGEWRLNFAVNDADQIQRALSEQIAKNGEYREVIPVRLIADRKSTGEEIKQATKANLQTVLRLLAGKTVTPEAQALIPSSTKLLRAGKAEPEDLVIISISSHGVEDQGVFYLLPYDIGRGRGKTLTPDFLERCISSEELAAWMREIDAGTMILIVDACKSAALVETKEFKPGPMGDSGLGQLAYDKGMQILTASQSNQEAGENVALQLSYLTQALINEGIKAGQADQLPRDGQITLGEWLQFGVKRVPELQVKEARQRQTPKTGRNISSGNRGTELTEASAPQRPSLFDFRRQRREVTLVKKAISQPRK